MKTSDFEYSLPREFIAQDPVSPRDRCKLMVYDSGKDLILHRRFFEIGEFLNAGDVIVLNRSRVVPARIIFYLNGAAKEIFLLKKLSKCRYQAWVKPGRSFKDGAKLKIDRDLVCKTVDVLPDGSRILDFEYVGTEDLDKKLYKLGRAPLPPYINSSKSEFSDYQTVYAKEEGSRAAPTAGLHFTKRLLGQLGDSGVLIEEVLLHVGLGTFAPVVAENIHDHVMHFEEFEISRKTAEILNLAVKEKRRIVAVGTTSVRVLETSYDAKNGFLPKSGETNIFIYPGNYKWKVVDALITNFHLPKSTLIMLVASFLENKGIKNPVKKILSLYEVAKKNNYRFYSFGDAMLII